jgi:hypothetical protein
MKIQTPITLDEVKQQFQSWRENKTTRTIPESLWRLVQQLLENSSYANSMIGKILGINTSQLRKKFPAQFKTRQTKLSLQPKFKFVEAPLQPLFEATAPSNNALTIERSNGIKLSMAAPTPEQLVLFIKAFME